MVDARLADGSRINAIVPPLALRGPVLTVRKFPERALVMQDLIGLRIALHGRRCVPGGTEFLG